MICKKLKFGGLASDPSFQRQNYSLSIAVAFTPMGKDIQNKTAV